MTFDRRGYDTARRARARAFLLDINARTFCTHCGAQPVEWHNPDHVNLNRQNRRVGRLVSAGASDREIEAELSVCTPLCRRCHMREDGRLHNFETRRHLGTGSRNGSAKLTESDVREIRALRETGVPATALALQYGVTDITIRHIVSRRIWKHI